MSVPVHAEPAAEPASRSSVRSTSRDAGIANLTSLGIVLVVLGHSAPTKLVAPATAAEAVFRDILGLIARFHMPLFFFVSGYLFLHSSAARTLGVSDYGRFVASKARRLLLPYWGISTLAFPLKTLLASEAARPQGFSLSDYLESLFVPWQNTIIFYWFLPTLFLVFLFAPWLARAVRHPNPLVPAVVTVGLVALHLGIVPVFWHDLLNYRGALAHAHMFWLGIFWRCHFHDVGRRGDLVTGIGGGVLFAGLALAEYAKVIPETPWARAILGLLFAWAGVGMCLGCVRGATLGIGIPRIPGIDGMSYPIYLLSWFPQMFVKIAVFRWLGAGFWPAAILMFAAGLFVPVGFARFLSGRWPVTKPWIGMG